MGLDATSAATLGLKPAMTLAELQTFMTAAKANASFKDVTRSKLRTMLIADSAYAIKNNNQNLTGVVGNPNITKLYTHKDVANEVSAINGITFGGTVGGAAGDKNAVVYFPEGVRQSQLVAKGLQLQFKTNGTDSNLTNDG